MTFIYVSQETGAVISVFVVVEILGKPELYYN
jgi:hypothetical protein